jgi:hypothetical protein
MALSLDKVAEQAPSLFKSATVAHRALAEKNLTGLTAQVALVLDFSGSMQRFYRDGWVQNLVNKVVGLATQLDDDGEIDLFIFETRAHYLGKVNLRNFADIVEVYTKGLRMGTTDYAGAFKLVVDKFFGDGKFRSLLGRSKQRSVLTSPVDKPVLALFLTDGVPDDPRAAAEALVDASYRPVFWQLLSIGSPIPFLQKLDDLQGRAVDNADYYPVRDIDQLNDELLIAKVLDEYPAWVEEQRATGQIR